MAGYIHHAVAHGGSHEDTHRRNKQHTLQRRGFRSERRRKEVDGIIAHAHPEVEHGEHERKITTPINKKSIGNSKWVTLIYDDFYMSITIFSDAKQPKDVSFYCTILKHSLNGRPPLLRGKPIGAERRYTLAIPETQLRKLTDLKNLPL